MKHFRWTRRAALLGTALAAFCALAAPDVQAQAVHAIVTTPVGNDGVEALATQFGTWHRAGWVSKLKVLQAVPQQRQSPGFSGLALVTLRSPFAYRAWRAEAERLLGTGAAVREAKMVRNEGRSGDPARALYVANFYAPKISPGEYQTYTERYIAPNMNHQRQAGIMSRYTMYLEQGTAGRALLVQEYVDEKAFASSAEVKKSGKEKLMQDPEWKRINDTKDALRDDISSTLAKEVLPDGRPSYSTLCGGC